MNPVTRRSVMAGAAAAVAVVPALGLAKGTTDASALKALIKAHRIAARAFDKAIDQTEAIAKAHKAGMIRCSASGSCWELRLGREEISRSMAREYETARDRVERIRRFAPDAADRAKAKLDAREVEDMASIDSAFAEHEADEAKWMAASDAEDEARMAISAYRCRSGK